MAKKRRNAGYYSGRKTKKRVKAHGYNYFGYPKSKGELKRKRKAARKNPVQRLFRTKKAARAYAKQHGAGMKISVRKIKRGK